MRTASLVVNKSKTDYQKHKQTTLEILAKKGISEGENADFFVVLGGDGTMLGAVRRNIHHNLPFLGVNTGSVGFLTEEISELEDVIDNHKISKRNILNINFNNEEKIAVNDIVLQRQPHGKMLKINIYVNDVLISSYKSDGVILSTPTGSTAYSLSAGGGVVEPELEIVQITPICAHQLSSRPMLLSMNNKISITHETGETAELSIDGQEFFDVQKNEIIEISKGGTFEIIQSQKHSFYDRVKEKLR